MTGRFFRQLMATSHRLIVDIWDDITVASALGGKAIVSQAVRLLGQMVSDAADNVEAYFSTLEKHPRMSGTEEKGRHWQEGEPPDILENMFVARSFYLTFIKHYSDQAQVLPEDEARALDRERIKYEGRLAVRIKTGKDAILTRDPSFWTEELENEFRPWLEYRF